MEVSQGKTALFFGSFDPVHVGHLIIAEYVINLNEIKEVWFVVSPQSPFKIDHDKATATDRVNMLTIATEGMPGFKICDIELNMPAPHYTVETLSSLIADNPERSFVLLIGADNLRDFSMWRNHEQILEMVSVYVYPRKGVDLSAVPVYNNVKLIDAPLLEISSSGIRKNLTGGKSVRYMLYNGVYDFICRKRLYR